MAIKANLSQDGITANATAMARGLAMQQFLQQAIEELRAKGQNPILNWTRPPGSDNGAYVLPPEATMSMGGKTLGTELSDAFVQRENGGLQGTPGEILARIFAGQQWAGQGGGQPPAMPPQANLGNSLAVRQGRAPSGSAMLLNAMPQAPRVAVPPAQARPVVDPRAVSIVQGSPAPATGSASLLRSRRIGYPAPQPIPQGSAMLLNAGRRR